MAEDPVVAGIQDKLHEVLAQRVDELIDLWDQLGESGPTQGSAAAGSSFEARERYLKPLAKAFVGALGGSADHAALYFDERTRYVDKNVDLSTRRRIAASKMRTEIEAISLLLLDKLLRESVESALWTFHTPILAPPEPARRVLFIGDCLFVETRAFLVPHSQRRSSPAEVRHVFFSAKQPLDSINTAIVDEVQRFSPHIIGISLFTYEGVPPYTSAWRQAALPFRSRRALKMVDGLIELLRETVVDIRRVSDAPIAIHVPCGLPLDPVHRRVRFGPAHSRTQRQFLKALSSGVVELISATGNTLAVREDEIVADIGGLRAATAPAFAEADVPTGVAHTTRIGPALAAHYDRITSDYELLGRAKVLLVDLDHTLWTGVMAEGEVDHDLDGQRLLRELKDAGVLLVALSKNDEASIRWDEMAVCKDDFVLLKINWRPKPDNVSDAIRELDLGADAFVLLDDNPAERALVCEQVPGVKSLDPGDPISWQTLRRWLAFPSTGQTDEARRRTEIYRKAAERRAALTTSHDYDSMMRSLKLRYTVAPATPGDLPRLLELIQRTNQFNTTTQRHSRAEVNTMLTSPTTLVYVCSLRDRFGDMGIVAAAIFEKTTRTFDSVIMSCRAMGFGVELALLRAVVDDAEPGPFYGIFIPTDRNSPAADLFRRAGFIDKGDDAWLLEEGRTVDVPGWLDRD